MPSLIRCNKSAYRVFDVWCNVIAFYQGWPVPLRREPYRPAGIRRTDQALLPGCPCTGSLVKR